MTQLLNQLKVIMNATMLHYRAKRNGEDVVSIHNVDGGLIGIKDTSIILT
jgi:hypothetical protein